MTPTETGPLQFNRVAVIAKVGPKVSPDVTRRIAEWLERREVEVCFDRRTAEMLGKPDGFRRSKFPNDCDLAIIAGGDGTILSVARSAVPAGVPLLGVNLGSLGFLTEIQPDELEIGLSRLYQGEYEVENRMVLDVSYRVEDSDPQRYALLNDAVITKGALARMISVEVFADKEHVATYTSDGLIVSTPTGSTAYALSAGGPILDPRLSAFVIAPICPHRMTYRPLVVPGDVMLRVKLQKAKDSVFLTLDGQVGIPMVDGAEVHLQRFERDVRLIRVAGRGFFEVLRRKLRWGER
jgi:NAD+ kinase